MEQTSPLTTAEIEASLSKALTELEPGRLKYYRLVKRNTLIVSVVTVAFFIWGLLDSSVYQAAEKLYQSDVLSFFVTLGLGSVIFWYIEPFYAYKEAFRQIVMPTFFKYIPHSEYKPGYKINPDLLKKSALFPPHDAYVSDDYFSLKHLNVNIEFNELRLIDNHGKNSTTVFEGFFILFTFTEAFPTELRLHKDVPFLSKPKLFESWPRVVLESTEFEQRFETFSPDQVQARTVLTPQFMHRLTQLYDYYKQTAKMDFMQVGVFENHLLIQVSTSKDMLKVPSIHKPLSQSGLLDHIKTELQHFYSLAEQLQIDNLARRNARYHSVHKKTQEPQA